MTQNEKNILGLYIAFYNRAPDKNGFEYWVNMIDNKKTLNDIALGFSEHPVFASKYNHLNNKEFVKQIYINVLGREGDSEGVEYHTKMLDSGVFNSRADFIVNFINLVQTIELTPENFPNLTEEELKNAHKRQDFFKNKIEVASKFLELLGDKTNVVNSENPEKDLAYIASIKILSNVTEEKTTFQKAINLIEKAAKNLNTAIEVILNDNSDDNTTYTPPITSGGNSSTINKIDGTDKDEHISGTNKADEIHAGAGDDIIRAGSGVDKVYAENGDDKIVIVGNLLGGGKVDSSEDTNILGEPLTNFNGKDFNEDEDGAKEVIDGGDGDDTLYVYGTADISNDELISIEHVVIRSDVTFDGEFIEGLESITGDGGSVIRIKSKTGKPVVLDLQNIKLEDVGMIEVGENVEILINNLDELGGAKTIIGKGTIKSKTGSLDLTGYTITTETNFLNADGTKASTSNAIDGKVIHGDGSIINLIGTNNDDILDGTDRDETLDGLNGNDILSGGAGDDTFIISGSGTKTLLDTKGVDTIDVSKATTGAILDLSSGGTAGTAKIVLGDGEVASSRQPIDLYLLQDLSGSFSDDVSVVQGLLNGENGLIESVRDIQPDTNFGVGEFVDKPTSPFGDSYDYVYQTSLPMTRDEDAFIKAVDAMVIKSGNDTKEAQLEALYQTALRADDEIGFRDDALRIVLLTTDASYHKEGDFSSAGPNNGDTVLDGSPAGTGEDYPSIEQVRNAIADSNIYPVFAVTSGNESDYQYLVDQLGVGNVVTLSSNSSNIIDVISDSLKTIDRDFIENIIGTKYDDTITGNSLDNTIDGNEGNDTVIFSGKLDEYNINASLDGSSLIIEDSIKNRDGTDTLKNIEILNFNGEKHNMSEFLNILNLKTSKELFNSYHTNGIKSSDGIFGDGYYKLFFDLSSASYYHIDSLLGTTGMDEVTTDKIKKDSYDNLIAKEKDGYFHFLKDTELKFESSDTSEAQGFDYKFKDGYYIAYTTEGLIRSSSAMVGRTGDALFITFRGTDTSLGFSDWSDDFFDMEGHYDRYEPLLKAIDKYVEDNKISKVYISGHSLGGQMAMNYLEDHPDTDKTQYIAVTFEAANNSTTAGDAEITHIPDDRITNFEMPFDLVPDIDTRNYGKTIYLEYFDDSFTTMYKTHPLDGVYSDGAFDKAISKINKDFTNMDKRIYVDNNNDNIIITQGTDYLNDFLRLFYSEVLSYLELAWDEVSSSVDILLKSKQLGGDFLKNQIINGINGTMSIEEAKKVAIKITNEYIDNAMKNLAKISNTTKESIWRIGTSIEDNEIRKTGYDFKTVFSNPGGTLILNPIEGLDSDKITFKTDDNNLENIIVKGELDIDEDINITGGVNTKFVTGNSGDNKIDISKLDTVSGFIAGGAGEDTLIGSSNSDILYGDDYYKNFKNVDSTFFALTADDINKYIDKSVNTDILDSIDTSIFSFKDDISGGAGDDFIAGGLGNDIMRGGTGDDTFLVENKLDQVIENYDEGFDTAIIYSRFADDQINSINTYENVDAIIVADDTYTMSENIDIITNSTDTLGRIIVGNAGNNKLQGGAGDDTLIGGADSDLLIAGDGDDILVGSGYKQIESRLPDSIVNNIQKFSDGWAWDRIDADYFVGGLGSDIMYGGKPSSDSVDEDGDNDYFFIDVNRYDNSDNVDLIKEFYVASTDPTAEDYLIFSKEQLGISDEQWNDLSNTTLDMSELTTKVPEVKNIPFLTDEYFIKVNGISNYAVEPLFKDDKFAFILDYSTGDLYFDEDGDRDVGDEYLVANISIQSAGDDLEDLHANQILIVDSFDFLI